MNETSYSNSFFKSSDLRECRFFFNRLKTENIPIKIFDGSQKDNEKLVFSYNENKAINIQKIINDSIYFKFKNLDEIHYFIYETKYDMNVFLIKKDLIKSLFTDESSLFYSWVYLEVTSQLEAKAYEATQLSKMDYSHFGSGLLGSSKTNMSNSITYLIDSMKCGNIEKETLIYGIREKYISESARFRNAFSWAKKNDKNEYDRLFKSLIKEIDKTKNNSTWNAQCVDACKKVFIHSPYLGVQTLFLIWITENSTKENFIKRAYKSWGQKIYRKNIESKKTIKITLSTTSSYYLSLMKNNENKSNEKIINELIENAYQSTNHKKRDD